MKKMFHTMQNISLLLILGVLSFFTQELTTFVMLGIVILMLLNIYNNLDDIYKE